MKTSLLLLAVSPIKTEAFPKTEIKGVVKSQKDVYTLQKWDTVNSPNSGCLPNSGFRPLYTMLSHFAAFSRTKN